MRPMARNMSPDDDHITSKKNKIREISPKRRHLKRSASPFEKTRREIVPPAAKKRDKTDKVSWVPSLSSIFSTFFALGTNTH